MQKKRSFNSLKAPFICALLSLCMIYFFYGPLLPNLNQHSFRSIGDGSKNYYNLAYHIKHDSSYLTFEGMNYPYGEQINYVDMHPLLSLCLKFIHQHIFEIADYTVGILNGLMIFSLILGAVFLCLIFQMHHFDPVISILAGIGISFLSSNYLLWTVGHYALSYGFFFPLGWFLLLRYKKSNQKIYWSLLIFLNTVFWFFIHSYLGMILLSFTFICLLFWLFGNEIRFNKQSASHFLLQVLLPLLFAAGIFLFADFREGRVDLPYTKEHLASLSTTLLPVHSPFKNIYRMLIDFEKFTIPWSGIGNYIGLSTTLVLLFVLTAIVVKKMLGRTIRSKLKLPAKESWLQLLAAMVLLLFAMSIPFKYGLDFLLPKPLLQFIALGRFAWAFYFVITFFSFLLIKSWFSGRLQKVLLLTASGMMLFESTANHFYIQSKIGKEAALFYPEKINEIQSNYLSKINIEDYQAILPFPFYHGYLSLNSFRDSEKIKQFSMAFSYASSLPLSAAILSRPSLAESKKVLNLLTPPYFKKPILNDLPSHKAFLIIGDQGKYSEEEDALLKKAEIIYTDSAFSFYKLPFDSIFSYKAEQYLGEFLNRKDSLVQDENSPLLKSSDLPIIHENFDQQESSKRYRGRAALEIKKDEFNVVFSAKDAALKTGIDYELSFWYYNHLYDQTFNAVWIEIKNSENKVLRSKVFNPATFNRADGDWVKNTVRFKLESADEYPVLCSQGTSKYANNLWFDELLIRPHNIRVYQPVVWEDGSLRAVIKNNEQIELSSPNQNP